MIYMKKVLLIALLLYGGHIAAQVQTDSVKVYYRVEEAQLDPSFHGNDTTMDSFLNRLKGIIADKRYQRFNFRIKSYASLEGPLSLNQYLYEQRTREFLDYVRRYGIRLPGEINVWQDNCYNWEELEQRVLHSQIPYQAEVLDILRNTPEWSYDKNGKKTEYRKQKLMALQDGLPFRYMKQHFFPDMRYSAVWLTCEFAELESPQPVPPYDQIRYDTIYITKRDTAHREHPLPPRKPFYMAVKTNLLYDAALIPNIGVEFYLKNNWSLSAGWMYGWWKKDRIHWYWRAYGGDIAVRKWLGRKAEEKPLQGHHLGVYAQVLTYDFETGGRGYMGGEPGGTLFDRANFAGGVEYGYSLPVARRLNLDFTIGLGYLGGKYYEYKPIDDCYVWQATKQHHYFGPTKLEVSLVWLLGRENINKGKGGKR